MNTFQKRPFEGNSNKKFVKSHCDGKKRETKMRARASLFLANGLSMK